MKVMDILSITPDDKIRINEIVFSNARATELFGKFIVTTIGVNNGILSIIAREMTDAEKQNEFDDWVAMMHS